MAEINKPVSLHATAQLCHALLEQKTDIRVIQLLLGYKKLDTTGQHQREGSFDTAPSITVACAQRIEWADRQA